MVAYEQTCTAQAKSWHLNGARRGAALLAMALALGITGPAAADDASAATAAPLEAAKLAAAQRTPAAMRASPWLVVATRGLNRYRVVAGTPNVWQPLERGIRLRPGSVVESGGAGHIELFNGHDTVTVSPNSRIALPRTPVGAQITTILQESGTVRYEVENWQLPSDFPTGLAGEDRASRRFEVRTPSLDTAAKGTAFNIRVVTDIVSISVGEDPVEVAAALAKSLAGAESPAGRAQTAASDAPAGLGVEVAALNLAASYTDEAGTDVRGKRRQPWFKSLL